MQQYQQHRDRHWKLNEYIFSINKWLFAIFSFKSILGEPGRFITHDDFLELTHSIRWGIYGDNIGVGTWDAENGIIFYSVIVDYTGPHGGGNLIWMHPYNKGMSRFYY
ncbi:TPA: hypothetical protein ACHVKA_001164 [Yersinia enterocolitica]